MYQVHFSQVEIDRKVFARPDRKVFARPGHKQFAKVHRMKHHLKICNSSISSSATRSESEIAFDY